VKKILIILLLLPGVLKAQNITTIAGNGTTGYSGDGGPCALATFSRPQNLISDTSGNLFFADADNNVVRKITNLGIVSTIAGNGAADYKGDNGSATKASLNTPTGIALDEKGNLYIADAGNDVVRKVSTVGIITTIAGTGTPGYSGDNAPATSAQLDSPYGIAVDNTGNIYISESSNYVVRKINTSGIITTIAGNGTPGFTGDGGPATAATLKAPSNIGISSSGEIYIPDWQNHRVRKINSIGILTTIAGNGSTGNTGDGYPATAAELNAPQTINFDDSGNWYISDVLASVVRKVNKLGIIYTVAGNGTSGYNGDGIPAMSAELNGPSGIAFNGTGNMYIAEGYSKRIRKITYYLDVPNNINVVKNATIYPNPASEKITIKSGEKMERIEIVSLIGQAIFQHSYNNVDNAEIDISGYAGGIYFVKVNGVYAGRFLKE
jgi:hypothetical protein